MAKKEKLQVTLEGDKKARYYAKMSARFKEWNANGNSLGAYVLAFSYLEDRLTAMYVVRQGQLGDTEPSPNDSIAEKTRLLLWSGDLDNKLAQSIFREAKKRNSIVHDAMWSESKYAGKAAERVFDVARQTDKARKRQRGRLERGACRKTSRPSGEQEAR